VVFGCFLGEIKSPPKTPPIPMHPNKPLGIN
jgi:hypothetical protein